MVLPAEHFGTVKKRVWYKVKWVENPPQRELKGSFDLLFGDIFERYKGFLEVLDKIETEECKPGLSLGLGKTEEEVDSWIGANK